jgi:hypothetical protein
MTVASSCPPMSAHPPLRVVALLALWTIAACAPPAPATRFPTTITAPEVEAQVPEIAKAYAQAYEKFDATYGMSHEVLHVAFTQRVWSPVRDPQSGALLRRAVRVVVGSRIGNKTSRPMNYPESPIAPGGHACVYEFVDAFQESMGPNTWGPIQVTDLNHPQPIVCEAVPGAPESSGTPQTQD